MKPAVLYFSRTGNSKRVAEKIGEEINGTLACITDDISWKGPSGFARGAKLAAMWETTQPSIAPTINLSSYDKIVVVSPVWAGNPVPAVYSLIMTELARHLDKIYLVLTCGGMKLPVKDKIDAKIGEPNGMFVIAKFRDNENQEVAKIVESLKNDR